MHHDEPYLKLGPFKLEVASVIPYIAVFHHLLTDKEIDSIIEDAKPLLTRAKEVDVGNNIVSNFEQCF